MLPYTDPFIQDGKIEISRLTPYHDARLISTREHPAGGLFIHNYTPRCAYDRAWDDVTLHCRGLITDSDGNIVARPFAKIFNIEDHPPADILAVDGLPFTATMKMDGSLGILYCDPMGKPAVATRGRFDSLQAERATQMLYEQYADPTTLITAMAVPTTLLFEIIYPENRIVVDYEGESKLVLLAGIETATGNEISRAALEAISEVWGYPLVEQIACDDWRTLRNAYTDTPNHEGFVLTFATTPPFRMKAKLMQYVRLHRLLTQVNERHIWEILRAGDDLDLILEAVPDEYYHWVRNVETRLREAFAEINHTCRTALRTFPTRKETAAYFKTCAYPNLMFALLDNKGYEDSIWKLIEPKGNSVFKVDTDM